MNKHTQPAAAAANRPTLADPLVSWAVLVLLAIIWGSSFILMKRGLVVFSSWQAASVRLFASFLPLCWLSFITIARVPPRKIPLMFLAGFLGSIFPAFLFTAAQTQLSSSLTGILNALTPLFTFIVGILFFKQSSQGAKWLGLLLGLVGAISLVLLSGAEGVLSFNPYALLVVVATVSYAVNGNLIKNYLREIPPHQISAVSLLAIGAVGAVGVVTTDVWTTWQSREGANAAMFNLVLLGVFSTAIATLIFNYLIKVTSVIFASSVTYLIPIVAIFWGFMDGEALTGAHLICFGTILAGVWLVNKS